MWRAVSSWSSAFRLCAVRTPGLYSGRHILPVRSRPWSGEWPTGVVPCISVARQFSSSRTVLRDECCSNRNSTDGSYSCSCNGPSPKEASAGDMTKRTFACAVAATVVAACAETLRLSASDMLKTPGIAHYSPTGLVVLLWSSSFFRDLLTRVRLTSKRSP
jgi:hypothetical protein